MIGSQVNEEKRTGKVTKINHKLNNFTGDILRKKRKLDVPWSEKVYLLGFENTALPSFSKNIPDHFLTERGLRNSI